MKEENSNLNSFKTSLKYKENVLNTANKLKNIVINLKKKEKKLQVMERQLKE